jgi:hypothetical protein
MFSLSFFLKHTNSIVSVQLITIDYCPFLQILLKHITNMLPGLKNRINAELVAVAKEHAAYGDTVESTVIMLTYTFTDVNL